MREVQPLDPALRERARMRMRLGSLPMCHPEASYAGYGTGMQCVVCEQPISRADVEFEMGFPDLNHLTTVIIHMHFKCRLIWETERASLADQE
jgi:hypothetical protein